MIRLPADVTGGRFYSDKADVLSAKTNGAIPPPKRLRTLCSTKPLMPVLRFSELGGLSYSFLILFSFYGFRTVRPKRSFEYKLEKAAKDMPVPGNRKPKPSPASPNGLPQIRLHLRVSFSFWSHRFYILTACRFFSTPSVPSRPIPTYYRNYKLLDNREIRPMFTKNNARGNRINSNASLLRSGYLTGRGLRGLKKSWHLT